MDFRQGAGYDKGTLKEEEIQSLLQQTSGNSLKEITKETEALTAQANANKMNISVEEVEEFLTEISDYNAPKIKRAELKKYLSSFPKKYSNKEIAFLMNGQYEMEASQLHELLTTTSIEPFDPVEEAFKLLDTEGKGFLSVQTFKEIFQNLGFGEISPSDEDIFKEVADFDGDGMINLEDFRQILQQSPDYAEKLGTQEPQHTQEIQEDESKLEDDMSDRESDNTDS